MVECNYFPTKLLFSATRFDSIVPLFLPLYQSSAGIAVSMKNPSTRPVVLSFGFPHLPHQTTVSLQRPFFQQVVHLRHYYAVIGAKEAATKGQTVNSREHVMVRSRLLQEKV